MDAEHGIVFNKPYMRQKQYLYNPLVKQKTRIQGNSSPYSVDQSEILIPLSVIGDDVFCISMVLRTSCNPTEYEVIPPSYPGGMPQTNSFYWQEQERLAYFTVINLKGFIQDWELRS